MAWDREKEKKAGKAMTIGSCIYGVVFSIVWNILAASMGANFMLLFGIPFLIFMLYRLYVCIQVAKEDKKASQPQPDPWDRPTISQSPHTPSTASFCPYCATPLQPDFQFCPKCGRRIT
ncbi:MAG: hypothetical protein IKJ84_00825 [Oscillospiraceae bacterium]|nr:hypothetical protein [Oscillospiraceae bacterium]